MLSDVIRNVLLVVVGFALRALFTALGVEIPDELFYTLVGAVVAWILAQLGFEFAIKPGVNKVRPNTFK